MGYGLECVKSFKMLEMVTKDDAASASGSFGSTH